jgi:hypothetical protein
MQLPSTTTFGPIGVYASGGPARLVDPEATAGDLREFMTDMAVAYLGADAGVPMGASLSDPSWPHTIIELTIEQWISFDYSS